MTQQSEIAQEILSNLFMGKMEWRENFQKTVKCPEYWHSKIEIQKENIDSLTKQMKEISLNNFNNMKNYLSKMLKLFILRFWNKFYKTQLIWKQFRMNMSK